MEEQCTPAVTVVVRLGLPADFVVPDLGPAGVEAVALPQEEWHAVDVDTADHRLRARGIALRHSAPTRNGPGVWTLEMPGRDRLGPQRSVLRWTAARADVPAHATSLLSGTIGRAPLRWSAEQRIQCQPYVLRGAPAVPLGALRDEVVTPVPPAMPRGVTAVTAVTAARPAAAGSPARHLEVELPVDGGPLAEAVLRALAGAGAEQAPVAPRAPGRNRQSRSGRRAPGRSTRIGEVVRRAIADGLERIVDRDLRLRMDPRAPAPDDVHQARVAARRVRSELSMFGAILDPVWLRHVRSDLKWLGTVLGRVRDIDILLDIVRDGEGPPGLPRDRIRPPLLAERADASRDLAAALASRRYLDLLDRLRAAAVLPPFYGDILPTRRARRVLPGLVAARWHGLRTSVRRAGGHPSDQALHRIRIKAKALRYSAEVAAPVVGKRATRTARDARDLQSVLGAHHDAVTAEAWLRAQCSEGDADRMFAAGWIAAAQHDRQEVLRRRWPSAWKPLAHRKRHRWVQ